MKLGTICVLTIILGVFAGLYGQVVDRDSLREVRGIEIRDGLGEELSDLSTLSNPWPGYEHRFSSGRAYDLKMAGSFAFVANWTSIEVLNISDPTNPQPFTSKSTPQPCGNLTLYGNYILATIGTNGLYIYYFNPDSQKITLVTTFHYPSSAEYRNITVSGNYAYVSCRYGLEVIDISDINNPQHGVYISKGSLNKGLVVGGPYVFMAGAFQGVHIFDMSHWLDYGGPVTTYTIAYEPENTRNSYDIAVEGRYLYVADYYNGLEVFDWVKFIKGEADWWVGECTNLQTIYPVGVAVDKNLYGVFLTKLFTCVLILPSKFFSIELSSKITPTKSSELK